MTGLTGMPRSSLRLPFRPFRTPETRQAAPPPPFRVVVLLLSAIHNLRLRTQMPKNSDTGKTAAWAGLPGA